MMKLQKENFPLKVKDHLVTGEEFTLVLDPEKEMLLTKPQPKTNILSKYYESDDYISHTDNKKGIVSFLYQTVKKRSLKNKLNLITSLKKDAKSVLDIGAGTGDFLNFVKSDTRSVFGIEPNQKARELAHQKRIYLEENLNDIKGKSFDVITMWHVLEHIANLEETIKEVEALLNPNGILIIAVPNFNSFDAAYYKNYWAAFDVPRHLWHFSRNTMKNLFSDKLILQETIPMIFDSFYVSLLSEKNKTGKQNLIKAFFIGLLSNISAFKSEEYSSLIYCYKKLK
ncbi:MAG: methyltransferase [Flavobacteriaceae bacterium]|jgi:2-polyprenyl-3-methyl-5-hydroxy-6-metoxy-1,4-benzoquinol methylase|nr:methyltransferase [Flavobacteriaceae bacterium]